MVCTVYVLVCVGGFHFQSPNWWCMVMRNMARNMYQKVNIQVDKIQKGHGTWTDEAPEVFGTDQLEIQTASVSISFFSSNGGSPSWHSCHGAKSTQGCDVFPRFSHSFLALKTPTLRYNSPFVDLQRPVSGYSLDQRRYLAFQHVAWPLCRQLAASEDSEMARRGWFCNDAKKCCKS